MKDVFVRVSARHRSLCISTRELTGSLVCQVWWSWTCAP